MRHVISATPVILGGALVIPAGLLAAAQGRSRAGRRMPQARARIERLAMEAVMEAERALGHAVVDVSAQKCGWDVTCMPPVRGRQAAAVAAHRSQGSRQGPDHRHRHAQRNPLCAQPGRQVRPRHRAGRWGRL